MYTIDETMDLLNFLESVLDSLLEKKKKKGSLSLSDEISALSENFPEAYKAFIGMDKIRDELSELDGDERDMLLDKSISMAAKLLNLFRPGA